MNDAGSGSLQPTYHGHVATTHDALILFEACLSGQLHHVPRRPHDRERSSLIRSGHVFIYEENASGIKRWTDGVPWSPSRILGNFLVYRELLKPFPPGEKKRAAKRPKRVSKPGEPYPRPGENGSTSSGGYAPTTPTSPTASLKTDAGYDKETERALIGSLVDSYGFKEGGLVKKTMSVNVQGVHHHLVSYYKVSDALSGVLETPTQNNNLRYIKPRHELISRQNFRAPLDDVDDVRNHLGDQRALYGYSDRGGFDRRPLMGSDEYHSSGQSQSSNYYPSAEAMAYQQAPPPAPAHPSAYGISPPSMNPPQHAYYGHHSSSVKSEEFNSYNTAPTHYQSRFEPVNSNISPIGGPVHDRASLAPQPGSYPLRARPNGVEMPSLVDTKTPSSDYRSSYYSTPARPESASASYQSTESQRWITSPTSARSENTPQYPERTNYWPVPGNPAGGHGHYPTTSALPHWGQHPP